MKRSIIKISVLACLVSFAFSSCSSNAKNDNIADSTSMDATTPVAITPSGEAPEWGKSIKPEMQAVIEKLVSYGDKPVESLNAQEARKNHTPTDAVMDLAKENNISLPVPNVDTAGKDIDVNGAKVHLKVYTPKTGSAPYPVIVYYHGGGFVIANIKVYDASAQGLAEQVGAVVVSVAYRLAPEHKFPTAHNDAFAAYEWVTKNAGSLKGDPNRIAVVGESAGGNLAANVSIMARDKKIVAPKHQVLIYPIAQSNMNTKSYQQYAEAKPLNKPMMAWFTQNYLNNTGEAKDPRISLVDAKLNGLPSTTIITAEIDPLNNDGQMLNDKLSAAGVSVNLKNYTGVTHEFFGMGLIVPEAKDAQAYAASQLKDAFK